MNLSYKTYPVKYGFNLEVDFDKRFAGFYWEALSSDKNEIGKIDNSLLQKKKNLFVETSFTPEQVLIYPVYANSKTVAIESSLVFPGKWKLKFMNLYQSTSTFQIFGAKQNSYEGNLLIPSVNLEQSATMEFYFSTSHILDKLFIKKDNYSSDKIIISDFSLSRKGDIFISDQSLIKPEYANISRQNSRVVFEENSPIWSFFSIMFYRP